MNQHRFAYRSLEKKPDSAIWFSKHGSKNYFLLLKNLLTSRFLSNHCNKKDYIITKYPMCTWERKQILRLLRGHHNNILTKQSVTQVLIEPQERQKPKLASQLNEFNVRGIIYYKMNLIVNSTYHKCPEIAQDLASKTDNHYVKFNTSFLDLQHSAFKLIRSECEGLAG